MKEKYDVTAYWYNPNIHPYGEYEKRLDSANIVARNLEVPLIEDDYEVENWFDQIKGFEEEPEGGKRCTICFAMRLKKTAEYAKEHGFKYVTTTMTISPHKNAELINKLGQFHCKNNGVKWIDSNFKKKDGFRRSVEMSKEMGLYRQRFCGCFYSRNPEGNNQEHQKNKDKQE